MGVESFFNKVQRAEEMLLPRKSFRRGVAYILATAVIASPFIKDISDHTVSTGSEQVAKQLRKELKPVVDQQGEATRTKLTETVNDASSDISSEMKSNMQDVAEEIFAPPVSTTTTRPLVRPNEHPVAPTVPSQPFQPIHGPENPVNKP